MTGAHQSWGSGLFVNLSPRGKAAVAPESESSPQPPPLRSPLGPHFQGRTSATGQEAKRGCGMGALMEEVCQTPKQSEGKQGLLSFAKNKNIGWSSGRQPLKPLAATLPSFQVLEAKSS